MHDEGDGAIAEIGRRLQAMLARKRWTVQALERRAELGHTTVSRALNGRTLPSVRTLTELAEALGEDVGPLLELHRQASIGPRRLSKPVNVFPSERGSWSGPVFAVPGLLGSEVAREALVARVVSALTDSRSPGASVGLATRVAGTAGGGGFGKTTLARLVVHSRQVREHFPDGIAWLTVGQEATDAKIADLLNDVAALFTGVRPPLADALVAAAHLQKVLDQRRVLLVVDDVWSRTQLEPFLQAAAGGEAGSSVQVLVTTRRHSVLPPQAVTVDVNAMSPSEATQLLTQNLPAYPAELIKPLLDVTGRWPLLLELVNGRIRFDVTAGADLPQTMREMGEEISQEGPDILDLGSDTGRRRAVTATLAASLSRLTEDEQTRYQELAIFAEDVEIPRGVLERYWRRTAGWSPSQTRHMCQLLADLNLISEYRLDMGRPRLRLHDVVHVWLRHRGRDQLPTWHRVLVNALCLSAPPSSEGDTPWWAVATADDQVAAYSWTWLATHLDSGGLPDQLDTLLLTPQSILGKLAASGPASLEQDLSLSRHPACQVLHRVIRQDGHLLGPLGPEGSVAGTLVSRLPREDSSIARLSTRLLDTIPGSRLIPIGRMPDLPHPSLQRVLSGYSPLQWKCWRSPRTGPGWPRPEVTSSAVGSIMRESTRCGSGTPP